MNRRVTTGFASLLIAASALAADPAPLVDGLWIHHEDWEYAPADLHEKGDIYKYASAAVVNFCARGQFRMATGVITQSTKSPVVVIGASDGLAIYAGRWRKDGDRISVEYRLVSAEIMRIPDDLKSPKTHVSELTLVKGRLRFPFITRGERVWEMILRPAARYEKQVDPDFAECPPKPH